MKSWLDTVLSTPALGILLKKSWGLGFEYGRMLAPLLEALEERERAIRVTLGQGTQEAMLVETPSGFSYQVQHGSVVVQYMYQVQVDERLAGQLPGTKRQEVRPFTSLLEEEFTRLLELVDYVEKAAFSPTCWRIGVVASVTMALGSEPPGVGRLVKHLAGPWGKAVAMDSRLLIGLGKEESHADQCHHRVALNTLDSDAERAKELSLHLDWQRVFSADRHVPLRRAQLDPALRACRDSALGYFESIAEGVDVSS